jgi:lysophospholipase L1-like esterase
MRPKLLILGDSISLGVSELRTDGPAGRVETSYVDLLIRTMPHVQIILDAEIARNTAAGCKIVDELLAAHNPDAVLLMLGGNDGDMDWRRFILTGGKIMRSRTPVETFEKNLRLLASKALARGAEPILTDFPSHRLGPRGIYISSMINKNVSAMIEASDLQSISDEAVIKYRSAAARIAHDLSIPMVAYGKVLDQFPARMITSIDGVHPSSIAHRFIAREFMRVLSHMLQPTQTTSPMHELHSRHYASAG